MIGSLLAVFKDSKKDTSLNTGTKRSLELSEKDHSHTGSRRKKLKTQDNFSDIEGAASTASGSKVGILQRFGTWLSSLMPTEELVTVEHKENHQNNNRNITMTAYKSNNSSEKENNNGNFSTKTDFSYLRDDNSRKCGLHSKYSSAIKISRADKDYLYPNTDDSFRFEHSALPSTATTRTPIRKKSLLRAAYQTSSEAKLTSLSNQSMTIFRPMLGRSNIFSKSKQTMDRNTPLSSSPVTAHESFKLDEKLRYKRLLQNFTSSIIHTSGNLTRKYLHRPAGDFMAFEKAQRAGAIVKECYDTVWGREKKAQLEKTEKPIIEPKRKSIHPKSSSTVFEVIDLDSDDDELLKPKPTEENDDIMITKEILKTSPQKNSLEERLQTSPFYTGHHFKERREHYEYRKQRQSEAAEAALEKARNLENQRKNRDSNLENKIARRMAQLELTYPTRVIEVSKDIEELLPELTKPIMATIFKALRGGSPHQVVADKFNIKVTRKDIHTLAGLNWLNDEVINFYMNLIMERNEEKKLAKVYAFNTFFYPKLVKTGYASVRRWTKKVDIFSYELLIVPVHLGLHWCLATIDFRDKTVRYYDSMHGDNYQCLEELLTYLNAEQNDKKKLDYDTSNWDAENIKDIPQQMNGSDCGMFSCKFAEYLSRGSSISFSQEHMPYFRQRMIYEICSMKLM